MSFHIIESVIHMYVAELDGCLQSTIFRTARRFLNILQSHLQNSLLRNWANKTAVSVSVTCNLV